MTEPREEIDAWLNQDVQLLAPRQGTFERVSRRARRRKASQALLAGAGAVAVLAGVAYAPQLVSALRPGGSPAQRPVASGTVQSARPSLTPTPSASQRPGATASKSATEMPPGTALSTTASGGAVPASFRPTSITMIGTVGAVIGQAGTPGHCATQYCTSLAGTSDYGSSWYGVSAPLTGAPQGGSGVSQLRFLNLTDGWAYGPQLWVTSNGGASWRQEQTSGLRVTDLETAQGRAFALMARCSGTGSDYAGDCTSFSLYSSAAGGTAWQPVPGPARGLSAPGGGPASGSLVIASATAADPEGQTGYLLAPSGQLLSGPLTGGPWKVIGRAPASCQPGAGRLSGQPASAQLASGSRNAGTLSQVAAGSQLLLSCGGAAASGGRAQPATIYTSAGGASWQKAGTTPASGTATSLAASSGGLVVLATTAGIDYSSDDGRTWQPASVSAAAPAGGFSYVGMTTPSRGVAVPADSSLSEVFITGDGGRTWSASPIRGSGR